MILNGNTLGIPSGIAWHYYEWEVFMKNHFTGSISDIAAYVPCYEGGNAVTAIKKDGQDVFVPVT